MQAVENETISRVRIIKVADNSSVELVDDLSVEEPLEIRLGQGEDQKSLSVTMRTPGNDPELAAGFLFTEGIIKIGDQIENIQATANNIIVVQLRAGADPVLQKAERNFYTTSSCGVCGKASIDSILTVSPFESIPDSIKIERTTFARLRGALAQQQQTFARTGGLHAAVIFDLEGNFIALREDVGRHNALDKLIGWALLSNDLPLHSHILLLSGRASFELIQKASMAGIKIIAAIGAPSSLAVELATKFGVTLIGFLRDSHFNIYSGSQRIIL
jgi:FdhD protein